MVDGDDAVPYTLKIRSGVSVDSGGKAAGKGALIQTDKAATLATTNDQYLFQPIGFDVYNMAVTGDVSKTLNSAACDADHVPCVMESTVYESHPMDSRIKEIDDEVCPTVSLKWHKGAADTPLVCEQYLFENHSQDARYNGPLDVAQTVSATYGMGGNNQPLVMEKRVINLNKDDVQSKAILDPSGIAPALYAGECRYGGGECYVLDQQPVYCLQGNGIDRADTAGCNGSGWREDVSYTLNTMDRPAVSFQTYQKVTGPLMANSHPGSYTGQDAFSDMLVAGIEENPIALDRAFYNQGQNAQYEPQYYEDGTVPTLVAKGPGAVCVRYIVRRLTPTECARLQGFADRWGDIDHKDDFTDEEYKFWLDVRNTHAAINGKTTKEYTKSQMVTWYNKLHTDSAEYKMWGNGIALPPALFCMRGIAEVLKEG